MAMLAIAGMAMSAIGSISQAASQSSAANYNARVADQNAQIAQQQGIAAANQQAAQGLAKSGQLRANLAASGLDSSQGSAVDLLANSVQNASLDTLTTKYNYQLKAMGYQQQAASDRAQASNAMTSGLLNAATGAVGSASSQGLFSSSSSLPSISWTDPIASTNFQ